MKQIQQILPTLCLSISLFLGFCLISSTSFLLVHNVYAQEEVRDDEEDEEFVDEEFTEQEWAELQESISNISVKLPEGYPNVDLSDLDIDLSVDLSDIYKVQKDFSFELSEKDQRRKFTSDGEAKSTPNLNTSTHAEFVRFETPIWIDGHTFWCMTGEVHNNKPQGFAILDLSPECDRMHSMIVEFQNGKIHGNVAIFLAKHLIAEGRIQNGQKEGVWTEYTFNQVVTLSQSYKNGQVAAGPVIIGRIRNPIFQGFRTGVAYQYVGYRDEKGEVSGVNVPISFSETTQAGTEYSFMDSTIVVKKPGQYSATYKIRAESDFGPLVADGPCTTSYSNGIVKRGNCKERTDDTTVYRFISGYCEYIYPNGHFLTSTCDEGGLVPGAVTYLTGPDIDSQWVNVGANRTYSYKVKSKWKKTTRGIGNFLKDAVSIYHNPETWFNPKVWEDNGQRVIREFNRVMKKNPKLAKALETACGPKTGGCNYTSSFDPGDEVFYAQTDTSESGTTVSVKQKGYRSFASTYKPDKGDALDAAEFFWGAYQLAAYNQSLNEARLKAASSLGPGESLEVECISQYARVIQCIPYDGNASFKNPAKSYARDIVYGKTSMQDLLPETVEQKAQREAQILETLPAWIKQDYLQPGKK